MDPTKAALLAAVLMFGLWLMARGEGARSTPLTLRHDNPQLAAQQASDGGYR